MKISVLAFCCFATFFIITGVSFSQDIQAILNKSVTKCRSIKNGHYEMLVREKFLSDTDTTTSIVNCSFVKTSNDTLFPFYFHTSKLIAENKLSETIYTGVELIEASDQDHVATFYSVKENAPLISDLKHNFVFYSPFTDVGNSLLAFVQEDTTDYTYEFKGIEKVGSVNCYHLQMNEIVENDNEEIQTLRTEYHFWIDKKSFLPLKQIFLNDIILFSDTMYQYEEYEIIDHKLNHLSKHFSVVDVFNSTEYTCKEYVSDTLFSLLEVGSKAPDWSLKSSEGIDYSLKELKGNWILLDFFYMSCYPCIKALPMLHDLEERYAADGLMIIGVNNQDQKGERLDKFMSKHTINYPIVLETNGLEKEYQVIGYPTLYLIDKQGVIRYAGAGYSEAVKIELEQLLNTQ